MSSMLRVIDGKTIADTGTFWTWEGNVRIWSLFSCGCCVTNGSRNILGEDKGLFHLDCGNSVWISDKFDQVEGTVSTLLGKVSRNIAQYWSL